MKKLNMSPALKRKVDDLSAGINKITDEDAVSTAPLSSRSFKLQFSQNNTNRVANYDDSILEKYWNEHVIKQTFWVHTYKKIKYGVVTKALPKVSLYLLGHYTFVLLIMYNICNPSHPAHPSHEDGNMQNNTSIRQSSAEIFTKQMIRFVYNNNNQTMFTNDTYFCENFASLNTLWREKEHSMTRILTLLVGFYVGFIVRTWWTQLRILPTMDSLCIALGVFVVTDSNVKEEEVGIVIDGRRISIKQFKKDIARLFLLSWTMCMCRISKPLKAIFPTPKHFSEKRILTSKEFKQLTTCTNDDCWLEKWSVPLVWANKMMNSIGKGANATDLEGNVVKGVKFGDVKETAIALYKFKDQLQALSNQYFYRIPDLMLQCITFALYFFMFLGVFAGQGMGFYPDDKRSVFERLLCDFPIYYCVKYALLISWLKAAQDLQNPFGDDQ